ncbi:MAG: hypothetical protein ABUL49_02085 [bacterium]
MSQSRARGVVDHPHKSVRHPLALKKAHKNPFLRINDKILTFFSDHILASMVMFDIALIVPLAAINAPDNVKLTLQLISGSWIQWWALHALQRSQVKADKAHEAKADVDHEALTHLANQIDLILAKLEAIEAKPNDPVRWEDEP